MYLLPKALILLFNLFQTTQKRNFIPWMHHACTKEKSLIVIVNKFVAENKTKWMKT